MEPEEPVAAPVRPATAAMEEVVAQAAQEYRVSTRRFRAVRVAPERPAATVVWVVWAVPVDRYRATAATAAPVAPRVTAVQVAGALQAWRETAAASVGTAARVESVAPEAMQVRRGASVPRASTATVVPRVTVVRAVGVVRLGRISVVWVLPVVMVEMVVRPVLRERLAQVATAGSVAPPGLRVTAARAEMAPLEPRRGRLRRVVRVERDIPVAVAVMVVPVVRRRQAAPGAMVVQVG